ncbi:MAG TPA: S8 family serine peptidase [bacterium]
MLAAGFLLVAPPWLEHAGAMVRESPAAVAGPERAGGYLPSEIVVKFKPTSTGRERAALHLSHGGKPLREYRGLDMQRIGLPAGLTVEEAIARYERDPSVEYAQPNRLFEVLAKPNDPRFAFQWGLQVMEAARAWDLTVGSPEVVVAVIDTGVDYTHPDLAANIWTNPGEIPGNGIDDDGDGYIDDVHGVNTILAHTDQKAGDPMDDHGHGTHVAGTIGAVGNNGIGVVGVNWDVKILPCKFIAASGWGSTADAIECLEYVRGLRDRGVRIVATNNSWGAVGSVDRALEDAVRAQANAGIIFVAAAANDSADIDRTGYMPAGIKMPNVLTVAATSSTDALASFSNFGVLGVHLGAPGEGVLSTYPGSYSLLSGTSMAAPHVAGLAALLAADDPSLDAGAIRSLILADAEPAASLSGGTLTGGRVNAYRSLTCTSSPFFAPTQYPTQSYPVGFAVTLSAVSVNCATPVGPVTVASGLGQTIALRDDGVAPDVVAGDGTFAGTWYPSRPGEQLTFSSPLGSRTVTTPLLTIATSALPDPAVGRPYSVVLGAQGGIPPYTWSLVSGALPPGLSLAASGVISGSAENAGKYPVRLALADSVGNVHARDLLLLPRLASNLSLSWTRAYDSPSSFEEARSIAFDEGGGLLVAGARLLSANSGMEDFVTKLDVEGYGIWTRSIPGANYDAADDVAADGLGNIYVSGRTGTSTEQRLFLAKYDSAGTLLWIRDYPSTLNPVSWGSMAVLSVAGPDAIFLSAPDSTAYCWTTLTLKYDASGNLLWMRRSPITVQSGGARSSLNSSAIVTDGAGNAYLAGTRANNSGDYPEVLKYLPDGSVAWDRTYEPDASDPGDCRGADIARDDQGNLYVSGWGRVWGTEIYRWFVMKLDPAGDLVWTRTFSDFVADYQYQRAIALDGRGHVYLVGESGDGQKSNAGQGLILTYDTGGTFLGSTFYGSSRDDDVFNEIVADDAGGVFVVGGRMGSAGTPYTVLKYQNPLLKLAEPILTPPPGTFQSPPEVTVSSADPGAILRYTMDRTAASRTHGTLISSGASIPVTATSVLNVYAYTADGGYDPAATGGTYTLAAAPPTFSPAGGAFSNPLAVRIQSSSPGAVIRYTLDGSTPSASHGARLVSGSAVWINRRATLRAVAVVPGWDASPAQGATYSFEVAPPTFALVGGASSPRAAAGHDKSSLTVKITSRTNAAVIKYTTNGETPSRATGTVLPDHGTVAISRWCTLKAFAYRPYPPDWPDSRVSSVTYRHSAPPSEGEK